MMQLQETASVPEEKPADCSHIQIQLDSDTKHEDRDKDNPLEELRILVVTWNLMGTLPTRQALEEMFNEERLRGVDLVVVGSQECERSLFASFFLESKRGWEGLLSDILNIRSYSQIQSHVLQGLHLIVFSHVSKSLYVSLPRTNQVKTGFCHMMGNKGGISIQLTIAKKKVTFVNVHLAAHQNEVQHRNSSLLEVMNRLATGEDNNPVFVLGDMNYRMDMTNEECKVFNQTSESSFGAYLSRDQMSKQPSLVPFFERFVEGGINFPPTYKMKTDRNEYVTSRIPGWTDRIFYRASEGLELVSYSSDHSAFGSDHRPVIASFRWKIQKSSESKGEVEVRPSSSCVLF